MVAVRSTALSMQSSAHAARPEARRVAVVLNVNARRVDAETLRWVRAVVPRQDLFLSWRMEDGKTIAERILGEGYHAVVWGGGDGTFGAGVANLVATAARLGRSDVPAMGVLRLGTGNAMADAIGAGPATPDGLSDDLKRARRVASRRRLTLLSVEGKPAMFAGFGLDAQILDDFHATVGMLQRAHLANHLRSAGLRYFLAVAGRSVPRFMLVERAEIVAINRGTPAHRVDTDGRPIGAPIPAGRVLWRGKASLASAATIPYFGLGMKMFPHADREPGRFQLRLSDAGTAEILGHLPAIWKGAYASPRIHDFLVDRVELVLSRPAPLQCNGDLVGQRGHAVFAVWPGGVPVV